MTEPRDTNAPAAAPCDLAGARRLRRAFRFCVAACVFLSFSLVFSEGYLRFDKAETQYRMSLTLHEASARPVLRNVVKRDASLSETPNAKYVEALADVEESDFVLATYEQAYKLDPRNSFLIIKHGCRLFQEGRFAEARDKFREASLHPPKNALPRYLEAAALLASLGPEDDVSDVIALVARANTTGDPVVFPRPLWHSTLPAGGYWHAKVDRALVDRCLYPVYRMESNLAARANAAVDSGNVRDWDAWMRIVSETGNILIGGPGMEPGQAGVGRAIAGMTMQADALRVLARIDREGRTAHEERILALEGAMAKMAEFENARDGRIAAHIAMLWTPLRVVFGSCALVFTLYVLSLLSVRAFASSGRHAKAVPHAFYAQLVFWGVAGVWLALLLAFSAWRNHDLPAILQERVMWGWHAVTFLALSFGFVYPVFQMRQPVSMSCRPEETGVLGRIGLYAGLYRRAIGISLGSLLCACSIWVLLYRLFFGLYPFQISLLATGLEQEELELLRSVWAVLQG